jgi:hypothetical protein
MDELSWLVNAEGDRAGAFSPGDVARRFGRLGLAVHDLWDGVPPDRRAVGDQLGLSPAWIVGHLALLVRGVLESFGGGGPGELPAGFAGRFGPGCDGAGVPDDPESLIELFDGQVEALVAFLDRAEVSTLLDAPRSDDFGLGALMPHDTLQGHAAAALDYAGMYLLELTALGEPLDKGDG